MADWGAKFPVEWDAMLLGCGLDALVLPVGDEIRTRCVNPQAVASSKCCCQAKNRSRRSATGHVLS